MKNENRIALKSCAWTLLSASMLAACILVALGVVKVDGYDDRIEALEERNAKQDAEMKKQIEAYRKQVDDDMARRAATLIAEKKDEN